MEPDILTGPGATPFPIDPLAGTQTLIHRIDLATYEQFRETTDPRFFFQQLSDHFRRQGRLLIHLWEDVARHKPAVVASRLQALAGRSARIPARLTAVRRIDRPTALAFLEANHLQVAAAAKHKYGLWLPRRYFRVLPPELTELTRADPDELLLAVATFSQARTFDRGGLPFRSFELVRFANRLNCTVVGGMDKLLNAFRLDYEPGDVMTYADGDWSDGRSYERLGFERLQTTPPHGFWVKPGEWIRMPRPPASAEADLANGEKGLIPVWNAGSIKFVRQYQPLPPS